MKRSTCLITLFGVLLAQATASEFEGHWRVSNSGEAGAKRTIEVRQGRLRFANAPSTVGKGRAFQGSSHGDKAELNSAPVRGLAKGLLDEELEGSVVRLSLNLIRNGDQLQTRAVYHYEGKVVLRELWELEQGPLVELLAVQPRVNYDVKRDGDLKVSFRLKGDRARRVRVRIELPNQSGPRYDFYVDALPRRAGGEEFAVIRGDAAWREPGDYTEVFSGRDDSRARRILLGGTYHVVVQVEDVDPLIARARGTVHVAAPRAEHLSPQWLKRTTFDMLGNYTTFESPDATVRQRGVAKAFALVGNRTPAPETHLTPADVAKRLSLAASAVIDTHGSTKAIYTYIPTGNEDTPFWGQPEEDPLGSLPIDANVLKQHLNGQSKPLRDLHYLVIYACLVGEGSMPQDLIDMGADLVVAFNKEVPVYEEPDFVNRLFGNLSGMGRAADPPQWVGTGDARQPGVRSLGWAAREAATFADAAWFGRLSRADQRGVRAKNWATPAQSSIKIFAAPRIDPDRELAVPARHGDSTN